MKFQACILLIAVSVYLTETIKLPFILLSNSKTPSCCANTKNTKTMACHKDKKPGKKTSPKCNDVDCSNCPLTYMSTFQPRINFETALGFLKSKYPLFESNCLSEYIYKAWKPPNTI